jgi:hypothetical protein
MLKCVLSWENVWVIRMEITADQYADAMDDTCTAQQAARDEIVHRYLDQCRIIYDGQPPVVWTNDRNCPFRIVVLKIADHTPLPPGFLEGPGSIICVLTWYGKWAARISVTKRNFRDATDSTSPRQDTARGIIMNAYRAYWKGQLPSSAWWDDQPNSNFHITPVALPREAKKKIGRRSETPPAAHIQDPLL